MDQLPEVILLLFVIKYSGPKKTEMSEIFDILDNTRGLQLCPRIVACMAREVMESFPFSFFYFYQFGRYFRTDIFPILLSSYQMLVAAGKVNFW